MLFGLYEVWFLKDYAEIADAGFDYVHAFPEDFEVLPEAEIHLQKAASVGLKVTQNMPKDHLSKGDDYWIEWVETLAQHENLLHWYMPEEPVAHNFDHSLMLRLYEIIKEHDPQNRDAVLYIGHLGKRDQWPDWYDVCDVIAGGCYPQWHDNAPRVCVWRVLKDLQLSQKPVIGVPQFFKTEDLGKPGGYPTPAQVRFDAYANVIGGVSGLQWFSYGHGWPIVELREAVIKTKNELQQLSPIFESNVPTAPMSIKVISGPSEVSNWWGTYASIQALQKTHNNYEYLLACNLADEIVEAEFIEAAEVLFEDRGIPIKSTGVFTDIFEANDVHVYRWSKE